jgi:hypothetical protein
MSPADQSRFLQLVAAVHAYYRKDCSEFVLELWWEGCQEHDFAGVKRALNAHAKDTERGQFLPTIADVERHLRGTGTDRAQVAWSQVLEAIGWPGQYRDVVFDDPAIHASVVDLGGWPKVCRDADEKTLQFLRQRFIETYRTYAKRPPTAYKFPARLQGDRSPDDEYERKRLPVPQPTLIGNAQRALAIATGNTQLLLQQESR